MVSEVSENADKTPHGNVEYADPGYQDDKVKRYPIDTEAHVRAAWSYINVAKNQKPYTAEQVSSIKAKIESAAKKFSIKIASAMSASLSIPMGALNYIDCPITGDTIFKGVTVLAEGSWTDAHSRKEHFYPGNELAKMQLHKTTLKMQHDIYDELPLTNEIGVIENMKFTNNPSPRWLGDVRVFPTANGKDVATLIKRKQITDISSEVYFVPEESEGRINTTDLIFMGAATVRKGACSVCTFNEGVLQMATPKYSKEEMLQMMDFMAANPTLMDKDVVNKMYTAMDKAQRKEYMKSMVEDMKAHPEMIDDDMKESMKTMAKMAAGNSMVTETPPQAGAPGSTLAEATLSGGTDVMRQVETQLQAAIKAGSQDVETLNAELAQAQKQKEGMLVAQLESAKKKILELEMANKEIIGRYAALEQGIRRKELQMRIDALTGKGVDISTSFDSELLIKSNAGTLSSPRRGTEIDTGDFEAVSIRDMEN